MSRLPVTAPGMDADAVAAVLLARQRAIVAAPAGAPRPTESLLSFDLGGVRHGIPIGDVRAVAALPPVTPLPHIAPPLSGLVAWRGTVVNLFAPAMLLGVEAEAASAMILLRHDTPRLAIAVDALHGVVAAIADPSAPQALARSVDSDDGRLTRIDTAALIAAFLPPSRLQEG